jgi:hypothetical protein
VHWDDVEQHLIAEAAVDLAETGDVRPCLAAFTGQTLLAIAFVRPFERGRYHDALLELLALVIPLGADRLALSLGARAWSLDDPVPPVVEGVGDLRQRVVVVLAVDGTGPQVTRTSSLHPFACDSGSVTWGTPLRERGEGWVGEVMAVLLRDRDQMQFPAAEVVSQLHRCEALGHVVALSPDVEDRLAVDAGVTSRGE